MMIEIVNHLDLQMEESLFQHGKKCWRRPGRRYLLSATLPSLLVLVAAGGCCGGGDPWLERRP